jgi:dimethylhistidine N-methyltransferase
MAHVSDSTDRFSIVEAPIGNGFAEAVRAGLGRRPRSIPPRFFYDARGSELFERICALPEYYLTRTECAILERHAREFPPAGTVIEFGCGYGAKTRLLFEAFFRARRKMTFVPVDISKRALEETGRHLTSGFPGLTVRAIRAEFQHARELLPREPSLVLFLGSNIGNLDHPESVRFLSALRGHRVIVGFDMQKDHAVLHAAYDDPRGVTAEFNLNVLARINRELDGNFDLAQWEHLAFYNPAASRIEMHLVSKRTQEVRVLGETHAFAAGERIHTENSYKFSPEQIRMIAAESGFRIEKTWMDEQGWFSVVLFS